MQTISIKREVIENKYIADDGVEFDTKTDCMMHEASLWIDTHKVNGDENCFDVNVDTLPVLLAYLRYDRGSSIWPSNELSDSIGEGLTRVYAEYEPGNDEDSGSWTVRPLDAIIQEAKRTYDKYLALSK